MPVVATQGGIAGGNPHPTIAGSRGRRFGKAGAFGWGGLVLVVLIGARDSGFSGVAMMLGLFALVVGIIALARGQVRWARLGSRSAGGAALGTALVLITVGAVASPPNTPEPIKAVALAAAVSPTTAISPTTAVAPAAPPTTAVAPAAPPTTPATTSPIVSATSVAPAAAATVAAPVATATPTIDPFVAAVAQAHRGTALAAVARLTVKGRAPKTGYSRSQFGQSWFDTDHNGCDTRNDMLRRDLNGRQMENACKVLAGTLAPDPYTGKSVRFIYGGASEVDIDHVVALSDAWQKGAANWPAGRRLALANDPLNLLTVDASANRSKGDGDTATWLPANKSYRCTYVARQVAVKGKYGVWVTAAERDAMNRVLAACPSIPLPGPGSAPTIATLPRVSAPNAPSAAPAPRPAPAPAPAPLVRGDGATALCKDGTLSFAAHHQGACSHHGGVAVFYR